MKKILIALACATSTLALVACGGGNDRARQEFLDSCLSSATETGYADTGAAKAYCQCTLAELEKNHSLEEIARAVDGGQVDPALVDELMEISATCSSHLM